MCADPPPVQHQSATAADIAWYQHQQNAPWNWQASTNSPYGMPSRHFPFPPGAGIVPTTDFRLNSDLAAGGPSKFGMAPTVDTSGDPGTIGPRNTPDGTLQNLAYPNEPSGVTKAGTARRGRKRSSANAGGTLGDQDLDYAAFSEQRLKALEATQDLKGSVIAVDWNSDSTFKHVRRAHPEIQEGQSTTIIPVKQKMKTARYIKKPKGNQKGRSNTSSDKTKLVASDSEISPIVTSVSPTSVNRAPLSAEPCDFDAEPGKISEQGESGFVPSSSTATQSNVAITSTTSTSPSTKKTDSEITAAAAILTNRL